MVDANRLARMPVRAAPLSVQRRSVAPLVMPRMRPRAPISLNLKPPAQDSNTHRSLWGQISDAFTGIPAGVGALVGLGARQLAAPVRITKDLISGDLSASDLPGVIGTTVMPWQVEEWGGGKGADYFPLTQMQGESFGRTALNLRHPSRYQRAWDEGRIVDTVLEDAGNVSLVGAAATKVAGIGAKGAAAIGATDAASALERTAAGVGRVGRGLEKVSNLPITVPVRGARGVVRSGLSLAEGRMPVWAETGLNKVASAAEKVGLDSAASGLRSVASYDNPTPFRASRALAAERRAATAATTAAQRSAARVAQELHAAVQDMTPAEEGAVMAMLNKVGDVDAAVAARLRDMGATAPDQLVNETVRQSHTFRDVPEHSFTPEIQATVRAYKDGTLDAASRARIDRGLAVVQEQMGRITDAALNGTGRLRGNLNPAQMGDVAIDDYVYQALEDGGFDQAMMQQLFELRNMGYTWEDIGGFVPEVNSLLDNPQMYAARWRPAMRAAALANETFPGLDLPRRPGGLMAAGIDSPQYLPMGEARVPDPRTLRTGKELARSGYSGLQGVASEYQRVASDVGPYSFRALADKLSGEVRVTELNKAVFDWAERHATNRANTVLDPQWISDLKDRVTAEVKAWRGSDRDVRAQVGRDIVDELRNQGWEVLQGDLVDPKTGDFHPDATINYESITGDEIVLPIGTKQALTANWVSKDLNRVLRVMEKGNTWWKGNVLPFSIRWQLGDAVGGMYMAWVGGGIPPWKMIDAWKNLRKMDEATAMQWGENAVAHPQFVDSGLMSEGMQWMRGEGGPTGRGYKTPIGRGINKLRQKSFQLNAAINRVNRQGYLLARLQEVLDGKGLNVDDLGGDAAVWKDPQVQSAINDAVADANKVMGTFDELTPFERRIVKNFVPFYVWQRHITLLAWRTAVENPARMLWTLRLGSYGTQAQEDLPEFLKGGLVIGNHVIPLNWANPFNDVAEGSLISQPGKSLSPVVKLGAAAFGFNTNTMQPITRPFGSGNNGWTPLMWPFKEGGFRPAEMGYVASQMLPATRALINLAPTGELFGVGLGPHPRYQQGTIMVDSSGRPIDTNSRFAAGASVVGLPWPQYTLEDARNILDTARTRDRVRGFKIRKVTTGLGG